MIRLFAFQVILEEYWCQNPGLTGKSESVCLKRLNEGCTMTNEEIIEMFGNEFPGLEEYL